VSSIIRDSGRILVNVWEGRWPLMWKTWECLGIWQRSGRCRGIDQKSGKCEGIVSEKILSVKTVYRELNFWGCIWTIVGLVLPVLMILLLNNLWWTLL